MNIYNEIFSELIDAKKISRQNFDPGRDKSVRKQKEEDLAFFLRREYINMSGGIANKPVDLSKIISISTDVIRDAGDTTSRTSCEIVYDPEKMDRILGSNLSTPTDDFPVALVSPVDIEVFPSTISSVTLSYYAKPTSFDSDAQISINPPYYDFNAVNYTGQEVELFNAQNSRNFMLPPHYLTEVVMEMAKLIGVRLRDQQISAFAIQEEAAE
tara:strand:- start:192 stop:830 length:639 start_codon:yes stop_codon:yes gene_type:complete